MDFDDDDAFLYGTTEDQPPSASTTVAPIDLNQQDDDASDSESDLEIILDGDTTAPPPISRRPGVIPARVAITPIAPPKVVASAIAAVTDVDTSPVISTTTEYVVTDRPVTIAPAPTSRPQVQTGTFNSTPIPSTSASFPSTHQLTAGQAVPSFDVDFVPKDALGNDLFDLDIDALEDKPWRRPGANMADYFNYGMNELAWKNYAAKQRRTRREESSERNPFAMFAATNLQEAWQSLSQDSKNMMMGTIMGFQGQAMMGNGGGNAMNGMMGGGGPGGMMNGMMGMNGGGMEMYGNQQQQQMMQQQQQQQQMMMNGGGEMGYGMNGGMNMGTAQMGYEEESYQEGNEEGVDQADTTAEVVASNGTSARGGWRGGNPLISRGIRGGGGRGGGSVGAEIPKSSIPRVPSPLPANVPTGPRGHVAPVVSTSSAPLPTGPAASRRGYQDKDRQDRAGAANEGLDYGASATSSTKPSYESSTTRRSTKSRAKSYSRSQSPDETATVETESEKHARREVEDEERRVRRKERNQEGGEEDRSEERRRRRRREASEGEREPSSRDRERRGGRDEDASKKRRVEDDLKADDRSSGRRTSRSSRRDTVKEED